MLTKKNVFGFNHAACQNSEVNSVNDSRNLDCMFIHTVS